MSEHLERMAVVAVMMYAADEVLSLGSILNSKQMLAAREATGGMKPKDSVTNAQSKQITKICETLSRIGMAMESPILKGVRELYGPDASHSVPLLGSLERALEVLARVRQITGRTDAAQTIERLTAPLVAIRGELK
jgi:hypothetical protein